jgi:sugar phosphate isomerase/epimerase
MKGEDGSINGKEENMEKEKRMGVMGKVQHLSRRHFLGAAAGAAAGTALAPWAPPALAREDGVGKGGKMLPKNRLGIQLFTVRDLLADNELDLPGTFEMLSDAGYAEVEIGGTYDGRTAAEFRALAAQYGLKPEGSHVPGGGNSWRTARETIFNDAEALGEEFNTWGAEARARGLNFYFHNHPGDFALDGGTPIYDTLLEETDRKLVWFELDIAWIEAGGQSAFEYVKDDPSRYPLFHVKDIKWDPAGPRVTPDNVAQPGRPFWLVDVGKGDIDFPKIFSALKNVDNHHYFVEHDDAPDDETASSTAPRPRNPAGSANTSWTSRKYLAELKVPKRRN